VVVTLQKCGTEVLLLLLLYCHAPVAAVAQHAAEALECGSSAVMALLALLTSDFVSVLFV
jgi:hypothetical protein